MQFNSYLFILLFLPITVIIYFVTNKINEELGKTTLVISSLIFYTYKRIKMLPVLLLSIFINSLLNFILGKTHRNKKVVFGISVVTNITLLLLFKYLNFGIRNINTILGSNFQIKDLILPLGISFYTFQQIAWTTGVLRGEIKSTYLDYLTYILFFPKLLIGPLMEPDDFLEQINDSTRKTINWDSLAIGLKTFSYGLIKKALLADAFSDAVSWAHMYHDYLTSMDIVLVIVFYTFEIYFDFSGYSDMAVGVSKMFNINLPINFDSPYKALSIRDFWKRWHISLTKFFTKYVYIPLGGSKKVEVLTYVNIMIVFIISGLWHGASWTFVLWGLLHGLFCVFDRWLEKRHLAFFEPFRWLLTMIVVGNLWLLFDADSTSQWLEMVSSVIHMQDTSITLGLINEFELPESRFIFEFLHLTKIYYSIPYLGMYIFIAISAFICFVPENNYRNKGKFTPLTMITTGLLFFWGIICLGGISNFVYNGF